MTLQRKQSRNSSSLPQDYAEKCPVYRGQGLGPLWQLQQVTRSSATKILRVTILDVERLCHLDHGQGRAVARGTMTVETAAL